MDTINRSSVTQSKGKLARTLAKVLQIRAVTNVDKVAKNKSQEKIVHDKAISRTLRKAVDEEDEKLQENRAVTEAFLAKMFASISVVKSAYAQLQFSQSPYDAEGIQLSDRIVVSELKKLSEFKQSYLKKQIKDPSPGTTQLLAEIEEQKSLLKTFEITSKKLESQVKLKNSEIMFLKEKLEDATRENKLIEKRLNSSGPLSPLDNFQFSSLSISHFIAALRQTVKSIQSFVRLLINEMKTSGWDLDAASNSIEPGVVYSIPTHKCYAFESFVCREMFDEFNVPYFSVQGESFSNEEKHKRVFFDSFMELKSLRPREYISWKPNSMFAKFCWTKYLRLVHPKLENSLFGNLTQRRSVNAGEFPETPFFTAFSEMAKRVWLVHCLAFSVGDNPSVFRVGKGSRFSEVYMEGVNEETGMNPRVGFTVVPGFEIGKTVVQCQVYLSD